MFRASRIDPTKSAYEILDGPYDWNRYPLAPLGCKAIVYKDGNTRGSWASRGVDAWYLGPSKDHYRCNLYYIIETRAYHVSGSTELFPQHCQLPDMNPHKHLKALTEELVEATNVASNTPKGKQLLKMIAQKIDDLLHPTPPIDEQRVANDERLAQQMEEQRVIDEAPIITIPRITDLPPIVTSNNPTAKRKLKETKRVHRRVTRNNTLGIMPRNVTPNNNNITAKQRSSWTTQQTHAINILTLMELATSKPSHTPRALMKYAKMPIDDEHYANPMVHPVTDETISSCKKLMHDPATAEVWQTAFGKDFGSMAQGDNKTGQKGTNAMFVMTHDKIARTIAANKRLTYGYPVVDYRPPKEFPHRIQITAGGNLIKYDASASVQTADLDTTTLHWNRVISTKDACYMCLDIKIFHLTAALEYYEYVKIPLTLFPVWIVEQYNLNKHAVHGFVHLEMRRAVWGLPQAGILANKCLRWKLAPFGYHESENTPGLWYHKSRSITFTLVVDNFGVRYVCKEDVQHLITSIKNGLHNY